MYFKHLNRKNKNRSQIIISTIFSLMISIIVIYISLYPILSVLKNLKETTEYYQSIANSISIRYIEDCAQKESCAYDLLVNTSTYSDNFTCNSTSSISRQSVCYLDIIATNSLYATPTIVNRTSIGCNLKLRGSDDFEYNFSAMTKIENIENSAETVAILRRNFLGRYNNSLFILSEVNKLSPFCEFP
jgi:ABC-type uncharacterized transport system permease subunit